MTNKDIRILSLKGEPRKQGKVIGKELKKLIKKHINIMKMLIFEYYKKNPEEIINNFIENTKILNAVKNSTPFLLEEVEGIEEGSGLNFKDIFISQCLDELIWYKLSLDKQLSNHCSALGYFNDSKNPPILAQNIDHINIFKDFGVILHIYDSNTFLESYIYTLSGLIALTGLNNQGIGICTNGLSLILNYSKEGVPVSFVVREILNQQNFEGALKFIYDVKHSSGQNYIIGGSEKISCFECSGNKVVQYIPYKEAKSIYHTNHPLVNDDLMILTNKGNNIVKDNNSILRFNYLETQLREKSGRITIKQVKEILCSHQGFICRHVSKEIDATHTLASVIYFLSQDPEFYYANGPPCFNNYLKFKFNNNEKILQN